MYCLVGWLIRSFLNIKKLINNRDLLPQHPLGKLTYSTSATYFLLLLRNDKCSSKKSTTYH